MALTQKQHSYLRVSVSERGVGEYEDNRYTLFIPRSKIQTIELKFGSPAEYPLTQCVAGSLLSPLVILGIVLTAINGFAMIRWNLSMMFFGGLGVWLLWEALRKRHFLLVRTPDDSRKVVFRGRAQKEELFAVLQFAKDLNYVICNTSQAEDDAAAVVQKQ